MTKIIHGLLVCLAFFAASPSHAQDYPNKVITMVVPFAAGGPTDTVARLIAVPMSKTLKQQMIIENVGGAGGTIAANRVAKAAPDGYTIIIHHIGMSTAPALYRKLPYDAINDFEPIGLINEVPMTLVAKKDFPAKDLKELIAYVKANKDKINYANAGLGAASHLCGMLFMTAIQTDIDHRSLQRHGPGHERFAGRPSGLHVRSDDEHDQSDQSRKDQGLRRDDSEARRFATQCTDHGRGWVEGLRGISLAWSLRAERHSEAGDRQADQCSSCGVKGR